MAKEPIVSIGFDLGINCGWAVIKNGKLLNSGTFRLPSDITVRMADFERHLLDFQLFEPHCIAVEAPNLMTLKSMHAARSYFSLESIIRLFCMDKGYKYMQFSAPEIKKFATDSGRADKDTVIKGVNKMFHLNLKYHKSPSKTDDDQADAIVVAILANAHYNNG